MKTWETLYDRKNITKLTYCGMLIGLSAIGSMIKISGSIAFDSMPGFFAALFLGPWAGAVVAGLGHLLTALTSGFPLTLPMHLVLVLEMGLFAYLFGIIYRKRGSIVASIVAIILNGPVASLFAVPMSIVLGLPFSGWPLFSVVILPLTLASIGNVLLAILVFKVINKRIR